MALAVILSEFYSPNDAHYKQSLFVTSYLAILNELLLLNSPYTDQINWQYYQYL